jgi:hypothetical protein
MADAHHALPQRADASQRPAPTAGPARLQTPRTASRTAIQPPVPPAATAGRPALGHSISHLPVHRPIQRQTDVIQRVQFLAADGTSLDTDHLDSEQLKQHEKALAAKGEGSQEELAKVRQAGEERAKLSVSRLRKRRRQLAENLSQLGNAAHPHAERSYHAAARDESYRESPPSTVAAAGFVVPLFSGTHFPTSLDKATYERETKRQRTGTATYAPAVDSLAAGGTNKDRAARTVRNEFLALRRTRPVRQWWGKGRREFDSELEAHQQRYVNTFEAAGEEYKSGRHPSHVRLRSRGIRDVPLISASEDPKAAVKFAKGFGADKRTKGVQGSVSTFLLSPAAYHRQGGFSVLDAHRKEKIKVNDRFLTQHEVNFPGSIEGRYHVHSRAVKREAPAKVADELAQDAERRAAASNKVIAYPRGRNRLLFQRESIDELRAHLARQYARRAAAKADAGKRAAAAEEEEQR